MPKRKRPAIDAGDLRSTVLQAMAGGDYPAALRGLDRLIKAGPKALELFVLRSSCYTKVGVADVERSLEPCVCLHS